MNKNNLIEPVTFYGEDICPECGSRLVILDMETGFVTINCNGVQPSSVEENPDNSISYTFLQVTKDITCTVTTEPSE